MLRGLLYTLWRLRAGVGDRAPNRLLTGSTLSNFAEAQDKYVFEGKGGRGFKMCLLSLKATKLKNNLNFGKK